MTLSELIEVNKDWCPHTVLRLWDSYTTASAIKMIKITDLSWEYCQKEVKAFTETNVYF